MPKKQSIKDQPIKTRNERVWRLEVTERQLSTIAQATTFLHRVLDGHLENELWRLFHHVDLGHDEFAAAVAPVRKLTHPDLAYNEYHGVGWRDDDTRLQVSQIAYEIEACLRHENWKRSRDRPTYVTSSSPPLKYSTEEFIRLEEIPTGETETTFREYLQLVCAETQKFHKALEALKIEIPEMFVEEYSCLKGLIDEALKKAEGVRDETET